MGGDSGSAGRVIGAVVLFALLHFVLALIAGVLAFGVDMDHLRSRTAVSRAAGIAHDVLWFPHDTFLRAIPNAWFVANARVLVPAAIIANSLLWGLALAAAWLALRGRSRDGRR